MPPPATRNESRSSATTTATGSSERTFYARFWPVSEFSREPTYLTATKDTASVPAWSINSPLCGTDLLITVDNGINAQREIVLAQRLGVDVIVIDHHRIQEQATTLAVWSQEFCGAGLAALFAMALALRAGWKDERVERLQAAMSQSAATTIAIMRNIWQTTVELILMSTVAILASAQVSTEVPLPEVPRLVQQAIMQQRFAETKEQGYVFREDFNSNKLGKECTWGSACQPPYGGRRESPWTDYRVLKYTARHFEVFWLDGIRVARVLPGDKTNQYGTTGRGEWTRDIPTTESELAVENQRVDSEIAEARALRAQGKAITSPDDPPQILLSRMLELCVFSNPRREVMRWTPSSPAKQWATR